MLLIEIIFKIVAVVGLTVLILGFIGFLANGG